jgi:hypothetical protein
MKQRLEVDPLLAHLLGDASDETAIDDAPDCDPVGDFRHQLEFGIPVEGATPSEPVKKLSAVEISDALNKVRQAIGGNDGYAKRLAKLNLPLAAMAASAPEFLPEDSPAVEFLQAAAAGDDSAMKHALRRMGTEDAPAI